MNQIRTNGYMPNYLRPSKTVRLFDNTGRDASTTMTAILGFVASYSGNLIMWAEALNSDMKFYQSHNLLPEKVNYNTPALVLPSEDEFYPVPVPGITEVLRGV